MHAFHPPRASNEAIESVKSAMMMAVTAVTAVMVMMGFCATSMAQDVNAGKLVYTTPQVSGRLSCSAGACHSPNPLINQNKILKAADNPGAIGVALNTVSQMAFLRGVLTTQQFVDVAAYIGNPAAAGGAPSVQLSPTALTFPATTVGASANVQPFTITNTGTATLVVTTVTSNNTEFSLVSSCGMIAAGASCNVSVGFTPGAAGVRSGTITVNHNAAGLASTVALSGTGTAVAIPVSGIQVTPTSLALAFGDITAGSFSGGQLLTVSSVGAAPLIITALSDTGAAFPVIGGSCVVGAALPSGESCTLILRFAPSVLGAQSKVLSIRHNAGAAAIAVNLSGTGVASPNVGNGNVKTMVEYLYAPLNYFFITSRADDKAALDKIADFQRTGQSFPVYASAVADSKAISRFYFDRVAVQASRGSHFYTLLDADKNALNALNPSNALAPRLPVNEGIDSWAFLPLVSGPGGSCASGQTPVYRLFRASAKFPDDPNHRFTTSLAVYEAFVGLGWDGEGVNFCVPLP